MTKPPVVVLGDVMLDVITVLSDEPAHGSDTASQISLRPGGSAANVAAWLADGGTRHGVVGRVGDDATGRQAIAALRDVGVDARVVSIQRGLRGRALCSASRWGADDVPGGGCECDGAVPDVDESLPTSTLFALHVSDTPCSAGRGRRSARARSRVGSGASRRSPCSAPLRRVGPSTFLELTADAQLLFANAEEAELLTRRSGPSVAAAELTRSYANVVVTCGAFGALYAAPSRPPVHVPAVPTVAVDSTGAGDAFAAGFLPSWLAGDDPAAALRAGHRRAARAVGQLGGRPA